MAYKPFDLTGKVALVTGGNGGIGLGMARALLASGAQVVIWGSNAAKTEAARAQFLLQPLPQLGRQKVDLAGRWHVSPSALAAGYRDGWPGQAQSRRRAPWPSPPGNPPARPA